MLRIVNVLNSNFNLNILKLTIFLIIEQIKEAIKVIKVFDDSRFVSGLVSVRVSYHPNYP